MALIQGGPSSYLNNTSTTQDDLVKRISSDSVTKEKVDFEKGGSGQREDPLRDTPEDFEQQRHNELYLKSRPYVLAGVALAIMGWWISATVLEATRHRWYAYSFGSCSISKDLNRIVQTFFSWAFISYAA